MEGSLDWALSLPDRGWDEIMARGIRQARARGGESPPPGNLTRDEAEAWASNSPNALSALGVIVSIERRGTGIADALLLNLKALARQPKLRAVFALLRPTAKYRSPDVSFTEYYTWAQGETRRGTFSWDVVKGTSHRPLPFDPRLRKHIRMGARIIKLAPKSCTVEGSALEWQGWLGDRITLDSVVDEHGEARLAGDKLDDFLDGEDFSTPVRWDPEIELARCVNTDMWVMHPL